MAVSDDNKRLVADVAFRRGITLGHLRDDGGAELAQIMRRLDAAEAQAAELAALRAEVAQERGMAEGAQIVASKLAARVAEFQTARPIDEYHEDQGAVLWWRFPIVEPPYCGQPSDGHWTEDYYTHWSPLPDCRLLRPSESAAVAPSKEVSERTAFEAWMKTAEAHYCRWLPDYLEPWPEGAPSEAHRVYHDPYTEAAWRAWSARAVPRQRVTQTEGLK